MSEENNRNYEDTEIRDEKQELGAQEKMSVDDRNQDSFRDQNETSGDREDQMEGDSRRDSDNGNEREPEFDIVEHLDQHRGENQNVESVEGADQADRGRHTRILERVREEKRRRQERQKWRKLAVTAGAVILLVGGVATASYLSADKTEQTAQTGRMAQADEKARAEEESRKAEEEAKAREEEQKAKQEVVDSYTNLGLVQVSGYLNVRRNPGQDADIIGKLQENSACEIIGTEGEWYHITSGEVEGYVHSQYILTGEEAKQKAVEYVTKMAIINTEENSLNIRSTPDSSSYENVVGQALKDERYPVIGETDGWVQIKEGYVSADYVVVKYALNEARKMDMREMVLNQYDNIVISKVDNYLNIRSEPTTDPGNGNVIGKMTSRAAGEILETLDGWYKASYSKS